MAPCFVLKLGRVDVSRYIEKGQRGEERRRNSRGEEKGRERGRKEIYITSGDIL